MQAYKEANDPLAAMKEKYAHLIPKKAHSAYWIWASEESQRSQAEKALKDAGEDAAPKKITVKLGELWKAMSETDKAPWSEKAKQAATEYEEKKKVWEATPEFVELSKVEKEQKDKEKEEKAAAKEAEKEEKAKEKAAAKEATKEVSPKKETPKKRKATDGEGPSPEAKKAKVPKARKAAKPEAPVIDADVLKKAEGLGLQVALQNLMARADVMAKEIPHAKMLAALQQSEGLVNKAKYTLLGA